MNDITVFWMVLTLVVGVMIAIFITVIRLRSLRRLIECHLPESVTHRDNWFCRAVAIPRCRYWLVPTAVTEQQAITALTETAKTYPGWIPSHRLLGRGARHAGVLSIRCPTRKVIRREDIPAERDPAHYVCIGLDPTSQARHDPQQRTHTSHWPDR